LASHNFDDTTKRANLKAIQNPLSKNGAASRSRMRVQQFYDEIILRLICQSHPARLSERHSGNVLATVQLRE
jgi:hypothetical protein